MLRRAIAAPLQAPTELQSAFVEAYLDGNSPTQAALIAGCAPSWAAHAGAKYLKDPSVSFAIVKGAVKRLARKVPMAVDVLDYLAQHAQSEKVRLDAAKAILNLAGIVAPKAEVASHVLDKAMHELSIEELRALVAREEAARANSAKSISASEIDATAAPSTEPMSIDDVELLG